MTPTPIRHLRLPLIAPLLLCLLAPSASAAPPPKTVTWNPNYTAALGLAKRLNKPILAYFSGSDWEPYTQKLDKDVLKTPMFAKWVADNVIPFQADYPAKKPNDPWKKQNKDLETKYQISTIPVFLLLDPDGEVIARATYDNVKLLDEETAGQPKTAIAYLDGMIKNRAETEPLVTYESLEKCVENAKAHKLPVLLLLTKGDKDPMILEAEKLLKSQRFVRWVNVNTSFHAMKWPELGDKSPNNSVDAGLFEGFAKRFKFGNTPAQLLMFVPDEEAVRLRMPSWNVMQLEPLMLRLQNALPKIEYKGTDWLTDVRLAKAIVAQQPRRILFLYFKDDSEFSQKMDKEIIQSEEMTGWPFYHCVLVKLDYSKSTTRPKALDQQNAEIANLYGVRGYPFVIMVNPKGQKIGESKYMKGGGKTFVEEMKRAYNADASRRLLFDPNNPAGVP
jgi:thioredoxin-related protein